MSEPAITFARLLAPTSVDEFFDSYFDKKPVHIKGTPDKVAGLCSWDDFNELIQKTGIWTDQTFKMVIDTQRVPPQEFCVREQGRDGMSMFIPSSHKVQRQMDNGASIVLDVIETLTPGIRAITEAMEMALATRISCNAYCSQNQRQAFPSHFDSMDVYAIHVEGKKTWRIYTGRFDDPLERRGFDHTSFAPDYHERAKGDLMMEIEMTPGDLLYLPKGWYHDALASSEACLHLSFGTVQPSGLDFLSWFVRGLDQVPAFRKPMPPHDRIAEHDAHIKLLKDELIKVFESPDVAAQFRKEQRNRAFGSLSNVAIPSAGPRFRVCGRGVKLVRRGQGFQISAPAGKGSLPDGSEAAVNWILERDHFAAGELAAAVPGFGDQQILELAQALASVGVVEEL